MKSYSIVIPHYNNADGLKRLLGSIYDVNTNSALFKEFINNLNVIVVDDYSDNYNLKALKLLNNKYKFTIIQNYKNKSAGACRNIGLSTTNSDYVIFSDSDDFFSSDYWKIIISQCDSRNFDIAFFPPKSVMNENIDIISNRHISYIKIIKKYFISKNDNELRYAWVVPWSKVFRTKFLKDYSINFDETIVSNDIMFSAKSGHFANNIYVSEQNFYISTSRDNSLEHKFNLNNIKTRIKVGLNYKNFCEKCGYKDYPDHFLYYVFYSKPCFFLYLLKYAVKIGALDDKKYFFKIFLKYIKYKMKYIYNLIIRRKLPI